MIARYIVDTVQSSRCRDPRKITKPISKRSSMAAAMDTDQRGTRRGSAVDPWHSVREVRVSTRAAAAGAAATGQGADKSGLVNKKKICINCGSNDHISYNPVCLNFNIHMQQLAAKAATIQRSAVSQGQVSVQWHSGTEKVSHLIKL